MSGDIICRDTLGTMIINYNEAKSIKCNDELEVDISQSVELAVGKVVVFRYRLVLSWSHLSPPADSPKRVTWSLSPPKWWMLSLTQWSAKDWSHSPWLPGRSSEAELRKPKGPSL